MAHPIKRFKAEDFDRNKTTSTASRYNLYFGQKHAESTTLPSQTTVPSFLAQTIKNEISEEMKGPAASRLGGTVGGLMKIKTENENEKLTTESIFASEEGLQPSESDINKIFDNSDDNSNDDHVRKFNNYYFFEILLMAASPFSSSITHHLAQIIPLIATPIWISPSTTNEKRCLSTVPSQSTATGSPI